MQTTEYFENKLTQNEQGIERAWVETAYYSPECIVTHENGRVSHYAKINRQGGQYLRVILLKDKRTVKDAFFERHFRPKKHLSRARRG
ncbi:hypothetical protein PN836_008110 [Ningiella sp. W23]|uniref:hypothetical protein n=1 Tax=Ningiella sp. W23 TaxID=3023715 RepID=UPI00375760FE